MENDDLSEEDARALRVGIQRRFVDRGAKIRTKRELLKEQTLTRSDLRIDIDLIDELPVIRPVLRRPGEALQRYLYDAYTLKIRFNYKTNVVTTSVRVTGITIDAIHAATGQIESASDGYRAVHQSGSHGQRKKRHRIKSSTAHSHVLSSPDGEPGTWEWC